MWDVDPKWAELVRAKVKTFVNKAEKLRLAVEITSKHVFLKLARSVKVTSLEFV